MRIPMRNGEPLSLEEMQQRQADMEDRLNAMHAELQKRALLEKAMLAVVNAANAWDESCRAYVEKGWFHTVSPQHSEVARTLADYNEVLMKSLETEKV